MDMNDYNQARKYVKDSKLKTNHASVDAIFKIVTKPGAGVNMYGKRDIIIHLKRIQDTLERLDPSYSA